MLSNTHPPFYSISYNIFHIYLSYWVQNTQEKNFIHTLKASMFRCMALGIGSPSLTLTLRSNSIWTETQSLPNPQLMSATFRWMRFSVLLVSLHFVQKQMAVRLLDGQLTGPKTRMNHSLWNVIHSHISQKQSELWWWKSPGTEFVLTELQKHNKELEALPCKKIITFS